MEMSLLCHVSSAFGPSRYSSAISDDTTEMWTIYKEVMTYYAAGLVPPDDVTLMFTDDNWGNIQRLPIDDEANRAGGVGVRQKPILGKTRDQPELTCDLDVLPSTVYWRSQVV